VLTKKIVVMLPEFQIQDHLDEMIEVVHGSVLNKAQLAKELGEKLPQLKRKTEKIKTFLSTYCVRGAGPRSQS